MQNSHPRWVGHWGQSSLAASEEGNGQPISASFMCHTHTHTRTKDVPSLSPPAQCLSQLVSALGPTSHYFLVTALHTCVCTRFIDATQ